MYMFDSCGQLITAPALSAETLANDCYNSMFCDCSNLINAPELPAQLLADGCYFGMFRGCSSLKYIKAMFTTSPSYGHTGGWVGGVSPTGTFVKNPAMKNLSTGISGIPEGWVVVDAA